MVGRALWIGNDENTDIHLDRITIPTLVIHSDADALVPYPNGQWLAEHITGAGMITHKDVGHLLPIEAAGLFNQEVINFI